ncbi:MAG TPA: hypothetical protein VNO21_25075, partial [Polyangiaceae bacterium]|nr:hypothetical protein [Polyangiaceae bacterium]
IGAPILSVGAYRQIVFYPGASTGTVTGSCNVRYGAFFRLDSNTPFASFSEVFTRVNEVPIGTTVPIMGNELGFGTEGTICDGTWSQHFVIAGVQ